MEMKKKKKKKRGRGRERKGRGAESVSQQLLFFPSLRLATCSRSAFLSRLGALQRDSLRKGIALETS